MATVDERTALLTVTCPHCGAVPSERCYSRSISNGRLIRLPITTLDGGSHDARWLLALGRPAPVLRAWSVA